eukprot:TRINITY_DN12722_c0_g4_i1.p1 TRINITY_DN12722_c0_g4~~TRINITY_DN12722_c0_g4_i1.p1  ORF type:complete len:151 (+),score=46.34 TRINITY_DN12722_c0_g4_i1:55-453(+)
MAMQGSFSGAEGKVEEAMESSPSPSTSALPLPASATATAAGGGGGIDVAHARYKKATATLRHIIQQLQRVMAGHGNSTSDSDEAEQLEARARHLRQAIADKDAVMESIIKHMRSLVDDVTLWQTVSNLRRNA